MSTENTPDEFWAAMGREVSQRGARPQVMYQDVTPPRPAVDRLLLACFSGYLPVVLVCLLWTVIFFGLPGLLSLRALLTVVWGLAISWAVYPILWRGRLLRPLRLIPLGLALIPVAALGNLLPWLIGSIDLEVALLYISNYVFGASHQRTLAITLPLWLALAVALPRLRLRFPWYDPIPPRRTRTKVAFAVLLLPVVANLSAAWWIQSHTPEAITAWEMGVVERQGPLGREGGANSPWRDLRAKVDHLSSIDHQGIRQVEAAALDLLERRPPTLSDQYNSTRVFKELLGRPDQLESPLHCRIALLECQLRSRSSLDLRDFDLAMKAFLESGEAGQANFEEMARSMRRLALACPSSLDELDHRSYSKRFWERDSYLTTDHILAPLLARYSPYTLHRAVSTRPETEGWIASRAAYQAGAPDPRTAEAQLKPRLECYEVLCELRAFRLSRDLYPSSLQVLTSLSVDDTERFEYRAEGTGASLVDHKLEALSTARDPVKFEWELK